MEGDKFEVLAEGEFVSLIRRGNWEYVARKGIKGIVVLMPITPEGRLVLVEQYRVPVGSSVIELPAGLAGDLPGQGDEGLELAAARELEEETGYRAGALTQICQGPPAPGISAEVVTVFLATDLIRVGPGGGDDSEDITVHEIELGRVERWLAAQQQQGLLIDPKIYMALYFANRV